MGLDLPQEIAEIRRLQVLFDQLEMLEGQETTRHTSYFQQVYRLRSVENKKALQGRAR